MENSRGSFGSKLGVILATAGSAVGLGNIWRFPYMTGQNGGAAFILIYLVCIFMLGIPGMVAEFIIGRHSAANAARSYKNLSNGKPWGVIGYMGVFTSMIILGFYAVVAGWCLQYLYASIMTEVQFRKGVLCLFLFGCGAAHFVDHRLHPADSCGRGQGCTQWYRACFQDTDAAALCAVGGAGSCFLLFAGSLEGCGVLAEARFL